MSKLTPHISQEVEAILKKIDMDITSPNYFNYSNATHTTPTKKPIALEGEK